jgi:hypothetical protein
MPNFLRYIGMKRFFYLSMILILAFVGVQTSCIEDGFTTSPSDVMTFSVDTLDMGTIFTEEGSTTHRFVVYNRASKSLNLSQIALSGENADYFRLNVDGMSGREFSDVEIRAKDSIFVLVEATLPANGELKAVTINADLNFTANGVTRTVVISADGQDVERLHGLVISEDMHFTADRPYQIFDSLVVSQGATLTVDAGAKLCFHDGSYMAVRGTLLTEGTPDAEVTFAGDRTGNVVTDISFDIMSRQWLGVFFTTTSRSNRLVNTCIKNTVYGVNIEGESADNVPDITLINSALRNSGDLVLNSVYAKVRAYGCEFAEAANGLVRMQGGDCAFNHCTFANYYLFSALGGEAVQFDHFSADTDDGTGMPYLRADFTNSIIYGNGTDLSHGDFTDTSVTIRHCLLKSAGSDDDNFIECLWDTDPLYYTVREDYYFDYRLKPDSPAIAAGDRSLTATEAATDRYGLKRGTSPDLGAYVFVAPEE